MAKWGCRVKTRIGRAGHIHLRLYGGALCKKILRAKVRYSALPHLHAAACSALSRRETAHHAHGVREERLPEHKRLQPAQPQRFAQQRPAPHILIMNTCRLQPCTLGCNLLCDTRCSRAL